jgi:hypothetical protein
MATIIEGAMRAAEDPTQVRMHAETEFLARLSDEALAAKRANPLRDPIIEGWAHENALDEARKRAARRK